MNRRPEPAIAEEEAEPLAVVEDDEDEDADDAADIPEVDDDVDADIDPVVTPD
jgi:hypothetical protein